MDQKQIDSRMEQIDNVKLSSDEEARIDEALSNARDPYDDEVAIFAAYDATNDRLLVHLQDGQLLAIPRLYLQDLAHVSPSNIGDISIEMLGMALHWPNLDIDIKVAALVQGLYGSSGWMRTLESKQPTGHDAEHHHAVLK